MGREAPLQPPASEHVADRVHVAFAFDAARCLAAAGPDDLAPGGLWLLLALSTCAVRHRLSWREASATLLGMRRALLAGSGLDPADEPTPLTPRDPRAATGVLAGHLWHLVRRVSAATGSAPHVVARTAALALG